MTKRKILIAADHAGFALKEALETQLSGMGHEVIDLGTHSADSVDYPDYANALSQALLAKKGDCGILVCGSGIGMCMTANRHKGVRAAVVQSAQAATLSRQHNDANVLCLGARLMDERTAKDCVRAFLETPFEGGRHAGRVGKMG